MVMLCDVYRCAIGSIVCMCHTLFLLLLLSCEHAILIQRTWRRYARVQHTRATIRDRWTQRLTAWRAMSSSWRSSWSTFQQKRRVHIHIPSLSLSSYQRLSLLQQLTLLQNSQLSRICDVADADVDVLYVAPFVLNADVQQYYMKLLEVGGVKGKRVHVVWPMLVAAAV